MSPPTNIWMQRRTEHRFYAEIKTDIYIYNIGVLTVNIELMWGGLETGER